MERKKKQQSLRSNIWVDQVSAGSYISDSREKIVVASGGISGSPWLYREPSSTYWGKNKCLDKDVQQATPCCFPNDMVHPSPPIHQAFGFVHDGACGGLGDPRGWQVLDINITSTFVKQNIHSCCWCRAPQSLEICKTGSPASLHLAEPHNGIQPPLALPSSRPISQLEHSYSPRLPLPLLLSVPSSQALLQQVIFLELSFTALPNCYIWAWLN